MIVTLNETEVPIRPSDITLESDMSASPGVIPCKSDRTALADRRPSSDPSHTRSRERQWTPWTQTSITRIMKETDLAIPLGGDIALW